MLMGDGAETPYPAGVDLLTGHERRTHNHCWRPRGTPVPLLIHTRAGHAVVRVKTGSNTRSRPETPCCGPLAQPQDFACSREG